MIRIIKSGRGRNPAIVVPATAWTAVAHPLGNVVAVAVQAAAAGYRHVCTSIAATISAGMTASPQIDVFLRDGASGVGAIKWAATLECPASDIRGIVNAGLVIPGSTNTAMTLEFAAPGGAGTLERVSMSGFDTV